MSDSTRHTCESPEQLHTWLQLNHASSAIKVIPEDFLAALQQDPATKAFYVNRHRRIEFEELRRYQAEQQQNSEKAQQDLESCRRNRGWSSKWLAHRGTRRFWTPMFCIRSCFATHY